MKKSIYILILFITTVGFGQITGNVKDASTGQALDFVNIWVKNTLQGTTTDANGYFDFESAKVGDTLFISYLGYQELEFAAQEDNTISLTPTAIELNEVMILPMRREQIKTINSYKKYKKINEFYYNGHYSLARFYEYKNEYGSNPFFNTLSVVVSNALKNQVKFKVYLIKADEDGKPSMHIISEYYILEVGKGENEITVDLSQEKLMIPKEGFFVVVDRLNLKENKYSNKIASDILQPAIGMEKEVTKKNTWLGFSGNWIAPKDLKKYAGSDKNIAINIELTD